MLAAGPVSTWSESTALPVRLFFEGSPLNKHFSLPRNQEFRGGSPTKTRENGRGNYGVRDASSHNNCAS